MLRYLRGTTNSTLYFRKSDLDLQGYVDTDLASDSDSRKSTTRYLYMINGTTVSQVSKLQKIVVVSTIEMEYVAMT